ncbi:MAG: hypothetical protein KC713_02405 [Candidatus Omnitrophica bacterium]|nr:hypothetical protein [Candidatus Omnitrophota bacterium]
MKNKWIMIAATVSIALTLQGCETLISYKNKVVNKVFAKGNEKPAPGEEMDQADEASTQAKPVKVAMSQQAGSSQEPYRGSFLDRRKEDARGFWNWIKDADEWFQQTFW